MMVSFGQVIEDVLPWEDQFSGSGKFRTFCDQSTQKVRGLSKSCDLNTVFPPRVSSFSGLVKSNRKAHGNLRGASNG